jgi:hypothetical protein
MNFTPLEFKGVMIILSGLHNFVSHALLLVDLKNVRYGKKQAMASDSGS